GRAAPPEMPPEVSPEVSPESEPAPRGPAEVVWLADAETELRKIPFFVRGKARRNTEIFARDRGIARIGIDTLYEAKAHYAR
ncbi:MAG: ferredoxin:protochlorophyllide reductase (ATP-dependent) subunit B, partial [Gemmobacter sp.]